MLNNAKEIVDAHYAGRSFSTHFRKVAGLTPTAGQWVDFTMTAGNPPGNFYASTGLIAQRLDPLSGIFMGDAQPLYEKYITEAMVMVSVVAGMLGHWKLCDFLLYYPFIDLDDTDVQVMINTNVLDRYTDGIGVHAFLVAQAPTAGSGTFTFNYINQDGVEKTSPIQTCFTASTAYGSLVTSGIAADSGPWLRLADNDSGIRRIVSFQNVIANGGLGAIVLVKPLLSLTVTEINRPTEVCFGINHFLLPRVYDNAFLGFLNTAAGTLSTGTLTGRINYILKGV